MITTNHNLRIDTFENRDLAYLITSPDRYEVSREVSCFLFDIKINPISIKEFTNGNYAVQIETREKLFECGLIVNAADEREVADGSSYNWRLAHEYLKRTYNYAFFDYKKDGWQKDSRMMSEYLKTESESQRFKSVAGKVYEPYDHSAKDVLERLGGIAEQVGLEFVSNIVVATFGVQSFQNITGSIPISRKCIPSGGGRHPTEAYIIDVTSGQVFHYCSGANSFANLEKEFSQKTYCDFFGMPNEYVKFPVKHIVLITCMWERNMFRYREPRTFRSVHLDAGHAVSNLEILSMKAGCKSKVQYGINAKAVEDYFGFDPLEEGVMCALMIGERTCI
jgi:SagB-type dehydrogenase family enzyme